MRIVLMCALALLFAVLPQIIMYFVADICMYYSLASRELIFLVAAFAGIFITMFIISVVDMMLS